MKKVLHTEGYGSYVVYFDFAQDFPQLGIDYIEKGVFTDADADEEFEVDEHIREVIEKGPKEECDESDYEFIEDLIKALGL